MESVLKGESRGSAERPKTAAEEPRRHERATVSQETLAKECPQQRPQLSVTDLKVAKCAPSLEHFARNLLGFSDSRYQLLSSEPPQPTGDMHVTLDVSLLPAPLPKRRNRSVQATAVFFPVERKREPML